MNIMWLYIIRKFREIVDYINIIINVIFFLGGVWFCRHLGRQSGETLVLWCRQNNKGEAALWDYRATARSLRLELLLWADHHSVLSKSNTAYSVQAQVSRGMVILKRVINILYFVLKWFVYILFILMCIIIVPVCLAQILCI